MGTIRQHKHTLAELIDTFRDAVLRLEAAVERLESVAPHSDPPTDPAALEAAEQYIRNRTLELKGGGVDSDA